MLKKIKRNIFNTFEPIDAMSISENLPAQKESLYFYDDPFDFYRKDDIQGMYIPKTQKGLRKAFIEGIIGIEFFIQMATSLRPLVDEAQDIDEITRLFSQQKLSQNPTPHSVKILRNMIKDRNPEIALYAAEGLNVIESSYIKKIQRLKEKTSKNNEKSFVLNYSLGTVYLKFSRFLDWQPLIKKFYLKEALSYLIKAYYIDKNHYRTMMAVGEIFLQINRHSTALKIFKQILSFKPNDYNCLMKLAECYFFMGLYDKINETFNTIMEHNPGKYESDEVLIYQWIL